MNFRAQQHAKRGAKRGRNRYFLSMDCPCPQEPDALRRRLRATSVAMQKVIRSHQFQWINHARHSLWDTFNARYVCCTRTYIYIHIISYTYIYMLTPPRTYQNDAKDAKSLFFQTSPMLIFNLILFQLRYLGSPY